MYDVSRTKNVELNNRQIHTRSSVREGHRLYTTYTKHGLVARTGYVLRWGILLHVCLINDFHG